MPLRMLARVGPLVLGALAAALWLRRRDPELRALLPGDPPGPVASQPAPKPPSARFVRASQSAPVDIVTVVDDLLGAPR